MNKINNNIEDKINQLNKKVENLVSLVDKKPNFYNNIFFEEHSKPIPLNLINTNYININNNQKLFQEDKDIIIDENSANNPIYQLNEPLNIFSLPSSEESGNEDNKAIQYSSFKSICDEVIDTDFLEIIQIDKLNEDEHKEEDEDEAEDREIKDKDEYKKEISNILKKVMPILMFKSIPQLSSIDEILKICKYNISIKPYEIKKVFLPSLKNDIFLIKFYSLNDAMKVKKVFDKDYNNNFHLCYDKRELKNSKWYCVIFRRESIKDKKGNYKFNDIINNIFTDIKCKTKNIITIDINNNNFREKGNIFYSAIKVDNLNDALNLCIKYNNYNNLKVNLHYLTYKFSKKTFPKILTQKDYIKEKKISFNKDSDSKIYDILFGNLNKNKNKKYKNDK
jgi:hypothetical protein